MDIPQRTTLIMVPIKMGPWLSGDGGQSMAKTEAGGTRTRLSQSSWCLTWRGREGGDREEEVDGRTGVVAGKVAGGDWRGDDGVCISSAAGNGSAEIEEQHSLAGISITITSPNRTDQR